jgi:hypothetical protein
MKSTKLSLVALIAIGAFGTTLSASPLEEAIKGVEVSGSARYRAYVESDFAQSVSSGSSSSDSHRFSGYLQLTSPVADNLKFTTSLVTDLWNNANVDASRPAGDIGNEKSFQFNKFYFQHAANGLNVQAGKIEIATPWTQSDAVSGSRGNGVLALYSVNSDWTLAGAAFLQVNDIDHVNATSRKNNLYALAAIGKAGPVGLQLWAANLEHAVDAAVFGEAKFALSGFNARGQVSYIKLAKETLAVEDTGTFYGLEGGYKNDIFAVTAGYTASDKDQPIYTLDNDSGIIKFGKQLYYRTTNKPDVGTLFVKGGASVDKFGFELGYGIADLGVADQDYSEAYGTISYKYAKNFGLELYYSYLNLDNDTLIGKNGVKDQKTNSEVRFQAQYNF